MLMLLELRMWAGADNVGDEEGNVSDVAGHSRGGEEGPLVEANARGDSAPRDNWDRRDMRFPGDPDEDWEDWEEVSTGKSKFCCDGGESVNGIGVSSVSRRIARLDVDGGGNEEVAPSEMN